jgi:hypothetical protein
MWKYKGQTLISVAGLAVGFACFAMATLWIRYEMTYDSFHKNADRIYCVYLPDLFNLTGVSRNNNPYPLAKHLKTNFPEIANAITLVQGNYDVDIEGVKHKADILGIDSSFFDMFDVRIIEGSTDFLIPDSKNIAISGEMAQQLFGRESPLWKKIKYDNNEYSISAVVTGLPNPTNYSFDFLKRVDTATQWIASWNGHTLIETVSSGVDMDAFRQKLYDCEIHELDPCIKNMTLIPLTSVHYEDPNAVRDVKFQHIIIFAVAGSLLILCTLFNYLTLFISRFRIRRKELALRVVYGASGRSLLLMLSVEFVMSLLVACLLGIELIRIVISPFCAVSGIKSGLPAIYLELIVYIVAIVVTALITFVLTLVIFNRRTLNSNMRGNKKVFRKMSIAVQLTVSIAFVFCTAVILKQMYHLHNTGLGFTFKNRASIFIPKTKFEQIKVLNDKIKQIPEIEETISGYQPMLPIKARQSFRIYSWDGKQEDAENIDIENIAVSEQYLKFHEFELVEGEFLKDNDDRKYVLINESAAKIFGWDKATGKSMGRNVIKGVIKNTYNMSPTIAAKPLFYSFPIVFGNRNDPFYSHPAERPCISLKYNEGAWKICRDKIRKIIAEDFPNIVPEISAAEDEYDKLLKSEKALLIILTVVSLVCVIVCVFGFVSMVSLTCEERRKEIAIRKINGATIKDILDIFFKEHLTLLVVGSIIAFPAGYVVMKRWLEQYVVQTEISAWIYLAILLALFMAIVLCVGGRVYQTSRENPIKAINN